MFAKYKETLVSATRHGLSGTTVTALIAAGLNPVLAVIVGMGAGPLSKKLGLKVTPA